MPKFATQDWADLYAKALNENEAYREAAGPKGFPPNGWEGDFVFVVEPGGNVQEKMHMWIGLYHGDCKGAKMVSEDDYALIKPGETPPEGKIGVEFIYSAAYPNWEKILKKELDSVKALLGGQAKLQGDMAKVMRATKAAAEMVNTSTEIDTEFW
ncbi:MAG: sterol carrier protein [Candidatus Hodarchaeota archaeon]